MRQIATIKIPANLTLETSIQFADELTRVTPEETFVFDGSSLGWVEPFSMLHSVCTMLEFMRVHKHRTKFQMSYSETSKAYGYAAHVGYFQALHFPLGNAPGEISGQTYLPITFKKLSELVNGFSHHGPKIENIVAQLASRLLHESSSPVFTAVSYSFCEMIRNVVEHSQSEAIGYCAQHWPRKNLVEIAIVDNGIGLRRSLRNNPYLKISSDSDALKFALAPGVSGKVFRGVRQNHTDDFRNSGYGLYLNYRLCNVSGDFFICSGQSGLYRTQVSPMNLYYKTNFPGTILRLRLDTTKLQYYRQLIDQFKKEGEMLARQSNNGAILTASRMSALLRENFQNLRRGIDVGVQVQHMQFGIGRVEDLIPSKPETLALVNFRGGRHKKVPMSTLIRYDELLSDDPPPLPSSVDDIPF